MRFWILPLLFILWGSVSSVFAAQPTLTSHSFTSASTAQTDISVTMSAGQAVVVAYVKSSTSNRTVTVTDDSGSNSYTSILDSGNCTTARCVRVFADYSVAGGTYTISVLQSSTFVAYRVWILLYTCATSCEADATSFLIDTTNTSHNSSADSTVIDTNANATLAVICTGADNTDMGTTTPGGAWEAFADGIAHIFAMYEDDIATAFADERGAWTSSVSVVTTCGIWAISDSGGGGGGGSGSGSGRLMLLGVG